MDKTKLANKFFDFTTREMRGGYWIGVVLNYFSPFINWRGMLATVAYVKIIFPDIPFNVAIPLVIICDAIIFYFFLFLRFVIGKWDEKKGVWKKQSEYAAKKEHLSPFNVQLMNQLQEHTKALGELTGKKIKNHLTEYKD